MPNKFAAPPCPACGGKMKDQPAHNSISRFHHHPTGQAEPVYICSDCGVAEAFSGVSFWEPTQTYPSAAIMLQPPWRIAWANR